MSDSYYDILGIAPKASEAEIKKAYRRLAKKYHPDVNPDDKNAEEKFKELNKIFEVLGDKQKRALYDEFGQEAEAFGFDEKKANAYRAYKSASSGFSSGPYEGFGGAYSYEAKGPPGFDFESFFGQMFGRRAPAKGIDFHMRMTLNLAEAVRGAERKVQMNGKSLSVHIPAGVDKGSQVRLAGQGTPGERGGPPGDLYIEIDVLAHPIVRREGKDLFMDLPLTLKEAALGAEVQVPSFSGDLTVSVQPGTQSGTRLRLKQRGAPSLKKGGAAGHLFLIVLIHVPPIHNPSHVQAIEHLETAYSTNVRERLKL